MEGSTSQPSTTVPNLHSVANPFLQHGTMKSEEFLRQPPSFDHAQQESFHRRVNQDVNDDSFQHDEQEDDLSVEDEHSTELEEEVSEDENLHDENIASRRLSHEVVGDESVSSEDHEEEQIMLSEEDDEVVDDDDESEVDDDDEDGEYLVETRGNMEIRTRDLKEYDEMDVGEVKDSSRLEGEGEEMHLVEELEDSEEDDSVELEEEEEDDVTERDYEEDEEGQDQSDGVGYEVDDGGDIDADIVEESDVDEYRRERTHTDEEEGEEEEEEEGSEDDDDEIEEVIGGLRIDGEDIVINDDEEIEVIDEIDRVTKGVTTTGLTVSSALSGVALAAAAPMIARQAGIQYSGTQQYVNVQQSPPTFIQHHQQGILTTGNQSTTSTMIMQQKSPTIASTLPLTTSNHQTFARTPLSLSQAHQSPLVRLPIDQVESSIPFHQFNTHLAANTQYSTSISTQPIQQAPTSLINTFAQQQLHSSPSTVQSTTINNQYSPLQQNQVSVNPLSIGNPDVPLAGSTNPSFHQHSTSAVSRAYTSQQHQSSLHVPSTTTPSSTPMTNGVVPRPIVTTAQDSSIPIRRYVTAPQSSTTGTLQSAFKASSHATPHSFNQSSSPTTLTANARPHTDRSPNTSTTQSSSTVHFNRFAPSTATSTPSTTTHQSTNNVIHGVPLSSFSPASTVQASNVGVTRHITTPPKITDMTHASTLARSHLQSSEHRHGMTQQTHTVTSKASPSLSKSIVSPPSNATTPTTTPWYATTTASFAQPAIDSAIHSIATNTSPMASISETRTTTSSPPISPFIMKHPMNAAAGPHRFQTSQPVMSTATNPISVPNPPLSFQPSYNNSINDPMLKIQHRGHPNNSNAVQRFATSTTTSKVPPQAPSPILHPSYRSTVGSLSTPSWVPPQQSVSSSQPWYLQSVHAQLRQSRNTTATASTQSVTGSVSFTPAVIHQAPLALATPSQSSFSAFQQANERAGSSEKRKRHGRHHRHHRHSHHKKHHKSNPYIDESSPEAQSTKMAKRRNLSASPTANGWNSIQSFFRNLVGA